MEGRLGDQTELTASVILNPHGERTHRNILHERYRSVGFHYGNRDGGGLVTVLAGSSEERESIMFATLGAYLGGAVVEGELALVGGLVLVGAGGTNLSSRDSLNDGR